MPRSGAYDGLDHGDLERRSANGVTRNDRHLVEQIDEAYRRQGGDSGRHAEACYDPLVGALGHQAELESVVGEMPHSGGCDSQRQREEQRENRHQNCPKAEA